MKMYNKDTLRQIFLDFFEEKNHSVLPSSSLIPANDPTLLLINSGMAQFKGKVQIFVMDVKSLAGLESLKKKSIFGKAKLINLSVMQVF